MRKSSFKKVLSAVMAATMVFSMAACGSATQQDSSAESTESAGSTVSADTQTAETDKDTVTLRMSWWGGDSRHEAILKAINLYEQKNPGIKIEGEYQGYDGYYEKMMTTLSSGTAPDLFQFSRDWIPDVQDAKHYLADLSTLPVDLSTLKEGVLENAGTYNGEPVLYSCVVGGTAMFVNTDFANTYGLDVDKQYTWKEFMELGQKIHEQDPEAYLMTADIDVLNRLIILACISQQTGGSLINEDTYDLNFTEEQMTSALQLIVDLYQTNTLEPFGEAAVFVGQMDQNNKWVNGKIGVLMDTTGACAKYEASISSDLDVMSIPRIENAKCSGADFSANMGFCINDASPYKEEAAKFLDFCMNDPEAVEVLNGAWGSWPTETGEAVLVEKGLIDPLVKKSIDVSQKDSYSINAISGNTELETVRRDIIQEVIYGDSTPEEGAKELVEQYKEIMSNLKK